MIDGSQDLHARARGYRTVAAIAIAAFVLLAARLWHLQVLRGESYYRKTADNFVKEVDLPASRGEIHDARGRVLVDNRPSYNVYLTPRFVTDEGLARLARVLHLGDEQVAQLRARAASKVGLERDKQVLGIEDIDRDQMAVIESDRARLPGISVDARPHRNYPLGRLAAHVLGYMNQINADELAQLRDQGYHPGDYIGRAGVERQWESYLRGKDGFERVVIDAKGQKKSQIDAFELSQVIGGPLRQEPSAGDNVVLTLDLDLQRVAERSLSHNPSGAAAAVEVRTGRVLALASWPAFDPNVLTGRLSRAEDERQKSDPYRPMIDKTLREVYFPGSTFKMVTALTALEDHQVDADEKMLCTSAYHLPGHTFHCMEVHKKINLHSAIVESCNIFFYHLGERVGLDRMAEMASAFGYGAPTGVGLPGEASGFMPTEAWYRDQGGFRIGYALNSAIGQGSTKVTVLQQALAYATLASGGDLWVPQLVDRIETASGRVVQQFEPRLRRHLGLAPDHIEQVRSALCEVVNHPKGTAWVARDPDLPVEVCGKTGTAQVTRSRKGQIGGWDTDNAHSWFVGFAPPRQSEVAIAVLVEHGGLGGHVAAPIVMDIARAYFVKHAGRPDEPSASSTPPPAPGGQVASPPVTEGAAATKGAASPARSVTRGKTAGPAAGRSHLAPKTVRR